MRLNYFFADDYLIKFINLIDYYPLQLQGTVRNPFINSGYLFLFLSFILDAEEMNQFGSRLTFSLMSWYNVILLLTFPH